MLIHIVSRRECEKFILSSPLFPPVTSVDVVLTLDLAHGKFIALRRSRSLPNWVPATAETFLKTPTSLPSLVAGVGEAGSCRTSAY